MSKLDILIDFFDNHDYKCNKLTLDDCTTITDLKKFVYSHISILKANSGNKLFLPYFNRLKNVYLKLKI